MNFKQRIATFGLAILLLLLLTLKKLPMKFNEDGLGIEMGEGENPMEPIIEKHILRKPEPVLEKTNHRKVAKIPRPKFPTQKLGHEQRREALGWYYEESDLDDVEFRGKGLHYRRPLDVPNYKIFVITPTYKRATQRVDLVRLRNTLSLVENLHWIVIEDANKTSITVNDIIRGADVAEYTHLAISTLAGDCDGTKCHKGVTQRNLALKTIQEMNLKSGVVYFGDDDNAYDVRVFEEMRTTKRVAVWPVAFSGTLLYEGPIVGDGKILDFHVWWGRARKFPCDMAGFSINATLITDNVRFDHHSRSGFLESDFLSKIIESRDELEPKANDCRMILVWHVKTLINVMNEKKLPASVNIRV